MTHQNPESSITGQRYNSSFLDKALSRLTDYSVKISIPFYADNPLTSSTITHSSIQQMQNQSQHQLPQEQTSQYPIQAQLQQPVPWHYPITDEVPASATPILALTGAVQQVTSSVLPIQPMQPVLQMQQPVQQPLPIMPTQQPLPSANSQNSYALHSPPMNEQITLIHTLAPPGSPFKFQHSFVLLEAIHGLARAAKTAENVEASLATLSKALKWIFEASNSLNEANATVKSKDANNDKSNNATAEQEVSPKKEALDIMVNSGAVPIVIYCMAMFESNASIQEDGHKTLFYVSEKCPPGQAEIGNFEGVEATVKSMENNNENERVCIAALNLLRNLTWDSSCRAKMRANGFAIIPVVNAMKTFVDSTQVQDCGCTVLSNTTFGNTEAKEYVASIGGIDAVIATMRRHKKDANIQARASFALRNLCWECPANQKLVPLKGGINTILSSLKEHTDHDVHLHGLAALGNITSNNLANVIELVNERGFQIILASMNSFKEKADIQENALSTIYNILTSRQANERYYAKTFGEAGGVETVLNVLSKFKSTKSTIKKACSVLYLLVGTADLRRQTGEAGAVELILELVQLHMDSQPHVLVTMMVLNGLISGDDINKENAGKIGSIEMIIKAMEQNPSHKDIQEICLMLLDNLADGNERNIGLEADAGVIKVTLHSMAEFGSSANLEEHACSLLIKLVCANAGEKYTKAMSEQGAQRIIEAALREHAGNPSIESLANQLLSLITADSNSRTGRSTTGGGASTRLRSRSRVAESGGRSRSRLGNRSRSPSRKESRSNQLNNQLVLRASTGSTTGGIFDQRKRSSKASKPGTLESVPE